MLRSLPSVLHREVFSFLLLSDRLEYIRINRFLHAEFNAELRVWTIDKEYVLTYRLENGLRGIQDPYKQLRLKIDEKRCSSLPLRQLNGQISLNYLEIGLLEAFQKLKRVHHLHFINPGSTPRALVEAVRIMNEAPSMISGLKILHLSSESLTGLPLVPELEELTLSCLTFPLESLNFYINLKSLRRLRLHSCTTISDVSCLDKIYDLELFRCSAITDISPLNNNYKIVISNCPIRDYSQSFENSEEIKLTMTSNYGYGTIPINMDRLKKIQKLRIDYFSIAVNPLTPILTPSDSYPDSLRSLTLWHFSAPFQLPSKHRLRSIALYKCECISLKYMSLIPSILLYECPVVKDFSPLYSATQSLTLDSCIHFTDPTPFTKIRNLRLTLPTLLRFRLTDMQSLLNVTYLEFWYGQIATHSWFLDALLASKVKELDISTGREGFSSRFQTFLIALKGNESIKKIVTHHIYDITGIPYQKCRGKLCPLLQDVYNLDFRSSKDGSRTTLTLLRKSEEEIKTQDLLQRSVEEIKTQDLPRASRKDSDVQKVQRPLDSGMWSSLLQRFTPIAGRFF